MVRTLVYHGPPVPLKNYLRGALRMSTRSLKRLKYRDGGITVNGERVTVRYQLSEGDVIELDLREETDSGASPAVPADLPIDIVWSDGYVTVADKPAGMPTHPVHGHLYDTAANALAWLHLLNTGRRDFVLRAAYRLDSDTSGLLVVANDFLSSGSFFRQVTSHGVTKRYLAITRGAPPCRSADGYETVDLPIAREDGRNLMRTVGSGGVPAVTRYRVIAASADRELALLSVETLTGRTHQIRVHMASLGCPLLGDRFYGEPSDLIARHALHACRVEFDHPADGRRMCFVSPPPPDMAGIINSILNS
ncbi:MAG: RluA family pseudouridine synthase [Clostridia bacterium]|nr:RluA family pseudouridine synthase [Clostridia bacterium]